MNKSWQLGFGIGRNNINRISYLSEKEGWGYFCGDITYGSHKEYRSNSGTNYWGELMEKGDIIGVKFEKNKENKLFNLSFFRNGKYLGIAWNNIKFEGEPLHFVVHMCPNTSVKYYSLFWSEENHKYFFEEIQKSIFTFILVLNRWKKNKTISVPKRLVSHLLKNIENTPSRNSLDKSSCFIN